MIMKKTIITAAILLLGAAALSSCNQPNELPPLKEGYASKFIIPDPIDLTAEDRQIISAMEEEYENAIQ